MNFILGLPKTLRPVDSIMVVIDRFSKMVHFIVCRKFFDSRYFAQVFFKEIVKLHGMPKSFVSNQEVKFTSLFWKELWMRFGTTLKFSFTCHHQTYG